MKKVTKLQFKGIQDVLSREEMKTIMAGSGGDGCGSCQDKEGSWACGSSTGRGGETICTCPSAVIADNKCS